MGRYDLIERRIQIRVGPSFLRVLMVATAYVTSPVALV